MNNELLEELKSVKSRLAEFIELEEISEKSNQEFLLKLHTSIRHHYMQVSQSRKERQHTAQLLKQLFDSVEKYLEKLILERDEMRAEIENLRHLLDEKIYELTEKERELESIKLEGVRVESEIVNEQTAMKGKEVEDIETRGQFDIEEQTRMVEQLQDRIRVLEDELGSKESELARVRKDYEDLEEKYKQTIEGYASIQTELENLQGDLIRFTEEKTKEIEEVRRINAEKDEQIKQLQSLLEQSSSEDRLNALTEELRKSNLKIEELQDALNRSVSKEEFDRLCVELESERLSRSELVWKNEELSKRITELEHEVKERDIKIRDLHAVIDKSPTPEEIEELKGEISHLTEERSNLVREIELLRSDISTLSEVNNHIQQRISELEREAEQLREERELLRSKINTLPTEEEWQTTCSELTQYKDEVEKLQSVIRELKEELEAQRNSQRKIEDEVERLKNEIITKESELIELQKVLYESPSKDEYQALVEKLESQQAELDRYKALLEEREKENAQLRKKLEMSPTPEMIEQLEAQLVRERENIQLIESKLREELEKKRLLLSEIDDLNKRFEVDEEKGVVQSQSSKELFEETYDWDIEGLIGEEQVGKGTKKKRESLDKIMEATSILRKKKKKPTLGEILVEAGVINKNQLDYALSICKENPSKRLGDVLVELGYVTEEEVAQTLACQYGIPYVRLTEMVLQADVLGSIPTRILRKHQCVPIEITEDVVKVAMTNPFDLVAIEDLERASGRRVEVVVSTPSDIREVIEKYLPVPPA